MSDQYDPSFDRIFNIFHALLVTRSELSIDEAAKKATDTYRAFAEAVKPAAA